MSFSRFFQFFIHFIVIKLYSKYNQSLLKSNAFPKLFYYKSLETPQDLGITGRRILDPEYSPPSRDYFACCKIISATTIASPIRASFTASLAIFNTPVKSLAETPTPTATTKSIQFIALVSFSSAPQLRLMSSIQ